MSGINRWEWNGESGGKSCGALCYTGLDGKAGPLAAFHGSGISKLASSAHPIPKSNEVVPICAADKRVQRASW